MEPPKLTELFEQARAAQALAPLRKPAPNRHPDRNFFVADILKWALKDDCASMEHPFFSLSKNPDREIRHYERNGVHITVKPGADGMATIWDKDVLIYAVSQLVEAMNQGRPISRTVRFTAYDFLVATNRHTGGRNYKLLKQSFARLAGTRIETNITTNGIRTDKGFGLIDNWEIIRQAPSGEMLTLAITLNEWLFNAIRGREVLTLSRDYFRLDGALERRLYELARKHCGQQSQWTISLQLLHLKSGSSSPLKKFRQHLKKLATGNALPDYALTYRANTDQVIFERKLSVHQAPESVH